jgi:hypothetical protein
VDAESPWFMETFDENAFVTYLHMQVDAHMNAGNLENSTIHWKLPDNGIVLLELFGGIGTGLAAVLQAGIKVQRYVMQLDKWPNIIHEDWVFGFLSC